MEIITRKQAVATGKSKYFTGNPCKNGHTAARYTQSGTCEACLRGVAADSRAGLSFNDDREAIAKAKLELTTFGVRAYVEDLDTLRKTAVVLGQSRFPGIGLAEVVASPNPVGVDGLTGFYRFRVHPDDAMFFRQVAEALLNTHRAAGLDKPREIPADAMPKDNIPLDWKP